MIYLLALLGVIGCMLLVDRRFELFLWHRPLPALLVLAAGVAYFFAWDLWGIAIRPCRTRWRREWKMRPATSTRRSGSNRIRRPARASWKDRSRSSCTSPRSRWTRVRTACHASARRAQLEPQTGVAATAAPAPQRYAPV